MNRRVLFLVEVAIFAALALVLDIIPFLSFKLWAQGGSVSFAMIPIFIVAFRWGIKGGVFAGILFGFYQILMGAYMVTALQTFVDYFVAFGALGLAGVVYQPLRKAAASRKKVEIVLWVILGCFIGSGLRFLAHFYAGIVFYGEFAPEGQPVWLYSLVYNGGYMLPAFILSAIVLILVIQQRPQMITRT